MDRPGEPALSNALADQRRRWQSGERLLVEALVQGHPQLGGDREVVLDLVYQEIVLREELGETVCLAEYQERFPEYAGELSDLFDIHRAVDSGSLVACQAGQSTRSRFSSVSTPSELPGAVGEPFPVIPGFEILELLGRGGMGVVYKARQHELNRDVALKMVRFDDSSRAAERDRIRLEAQAVARLQHPQIVQIFEIGDQGGRPFLVLELIDGGSLAQKLSGTPLPPEAAARLLVTVSRALHYAHERQLVHRDLKPANILLTSAGSPKVADFGLAKTFDHEAGSSASTAVVGTPSYMAPEQIDRRGRTVGPASDVYGLGAVLYETLTGRPPFRGASFAETLRQVLEDEPVSPRTLQPQLPRDLETICERCLQKDPQRRYSSAAELADDLDRFLSGEPIRARATPAWERCWKWCRRHRTVATFAVTSGVLLLLLIGGLAALAEQERRNAKAIAAERDQVRKNFEASLEAYEMLIADIERLSESQQGAGDEQRQHVQRVIDFFEPLVANEPRNVKYRGILANAWHYWARIPHDSLAADSPADDEIVDAYRHAIHHCTVLLAGPQKEERIAILKANTINNLANIYRARERWDRAAVYYEQAISEWDALVRSIPENQQYRVFRANAIGNWAASEYLRYKSKWDDHTPSADERGATLAPVVARVESALAAYRAAFEADRSLRDWRVANQSKDFGVLVDLRLLAGDAEASRRTLEEWANACPDNKDARLSVMRQTARLYGESGSEKDLAWLFRQMDESERLKDFRDPAAVTQFDGSAFNAVRPLDAFNERLKRYARGAP